MAFAMVICYAVLILAVYPTVFEDSYLEQEYLEKGMHACKQIQSNPLLLFHNLTIKQVCHLELR